jgi:glycosyltransferase involved in cell wall biosynthesis
VADPAARYRSVFCSFLWPRHPGHSGGEIRDFHLLQHLLGLSAVDFVGLYPNPERGRPDVLRDRVGGWPDPEALSSARPDLVGPLGTAAGDPAGVPAGDFHHEVAHRLAYLDAYGRRALQDRLDQGPDFLFVSPQVNPIALLVEVPAATRAVLCTYDVEAVRMERFESEVEAAARFERANLARYDGVVAVSELDRRELAARYALPPDRIAVVENGVDTSYFAFHERSPGERPLVAYVGSLGYPPNREAALRLLRQVLPLVRETVPGAGALVVGQGIDDELRAAADPRFDEVVGPVDDVRPHLERAAVACVPLRSGSGTKFKVLEAMSAGLPVVCSPVAAEGLALEAGTHAWVGRSDEELARGVGALLRPTVESRRMAQRARAVVEARHAWPRVLEGLAPWLADLRARALARPVTMR